MNFTFEQTRSIAEKLAAEIHKKVSDITTLSVSISQRKENVYIDVGQNDYADTLAAPYSVRSYHAPLVSTPLEWNEVNNKLDRYSFTIDTIKKRLKRKGDLFRDVLNPRLQQQNKKILEKLFF
jgi:bifunctional non-homologous end joining protein LigD